MAMVVQHNLTAMNANRQLGITTGAQAKSSEKLSSGYRINRAGDDAAGLKISEKMRSQIRGLDKASSNAQDGVSEKALEYLKDHDVSVPDHLNYTDGKVVSDNMTYESHAAMYKHMLHVMPEGITEWFSHPALETDELKAIAPDWRIRVNDYRFLMSDEFIETLKEENIQLIGYEDIAIIRGKR